jgi:hypothetical protein
MSTPTIVPAVTEYELRLLWAQANAIAKSGTHRDIFKAEDAYARILAGRELGLSPSDAIRHMHLLDGEFVPSAEIQLALLKRYVGPDAERYNLFVRTPRARRHQVCEVEVLRREVGGDWESLGKERFTLEDAETQELGGEFWDRVPAKMLFWRAVTNAIDTFAPEVVHPVQGAPIFDGNLDELPDDIPPLPVAPDPLDGARVADPGALTKPQAQHIERFRNELEERGHIDRFVMALNAVGAPEHDEVVQRYMQINENQATELIMRLGAGRPRRRVFSDGEGGSK